MSNSFNQAQHRWEQSWISGPPDDPDGGFIDAIAEWSTARLLDELADLRVMVRHPEPGDKLGVARRHIGILEAEIGEREGWE